MQESRIKISSFQFTHHMRIMEHGRTNDPIPMFRFWSLLDNSNICMSDIRYTFANDNNWKVLMLMISMIPSSPSSMMKHIALLWVIRKIPIFITNNMNWNRKKINVSGYSHNGNIGAHLLHSIVYCFCFRLQTQARDFENDLVLLHIFIVFLRKFCIGNLL